MFALVTPVAFGCGWWGDGEGQTVDAIVIGADGLPVMYGAIGNKADRLLHDADRYRLGEEVPQDLMRAHDLYAKAALQGHTGAQYNLGLMYDAGLGVESDAFRAAAWFRLAAAGGNVHAQHQLGLRHLNGQGVARDARTAMRWLSRAAEQGHAGTFSHLARLYATRNNSPHDLRWAAVWGALAEQAGDSGIGNELLVRVERHFGVTDRLWVARQIESRLRRWDGIGR